MTLHQAFTPLTKQAVADVLDISVRSVENWINEGILPAPVKLGNRVYWHPEVFLGWLSRRLLEPPEQSQTVTATPSVKKRRDRSSVAVARDLRAGTKRKLARLEVEC
ncbi:helix-turn-helix transcriptional regulator [Burkholderia oklahomensis]|uniref:helix-turn-helix transcriptional regulator n=1 Tax=Burkholderia oklahomensis TaxID=342113 RepID=UPI0005D76B72|nr:helix-turn-helix domain-containing protein [Burkholderia oklahomensis]AJX33391.1 helix-turn-helix domain protein [Burkholderia oklahomensis C6786]MBI0359187.1 helix-turn-helix domain-containing protein [Burkholderia oklahomensis]SUW58021.1 Helix-turn-helix domain [Burkholderia oklahomensis]